jgi:hypothetical protein
MAADASGSARRRLRCAAVVGALAWGTVFAAVTPAGAVIRPSLEGTPAGPTAAGAALPADRNGSVSPAAPLDWTGALASGHNLNFDPQAAGPCGKTDETYCDISLVNVVPADFYSVAAGGVDFSTKGKASPEDIDLYVYKSDASGAVGDFVGASGGSTADESVSVLNASGYYLVVAVYFNVNNADYAGHAEFFRRAKFPPIVRNPPGLQDTLASNPALGFRSHSEPHISQSPVNPNILIAGSKMYNPDPNSLARYQFKIGTYVSFNRGRKWYDLGQLNVCPPDQAPPSSWPLQNRCYPAADPSRADDFGARYITSDVWTGFDAQGNAYAMVLDSPPFATGNGWGMSFHRWEHPSLRDVLHGRTWSNRIPINAYPSTADQASKLDDKNTFAVNTAGGRRKTGIIVACWGQNYDLTHFGRQQEVCKRSTDGGRSWPGDPQPISPPQVPMLPFGPFVIGVHVVADKRDPNTFYAVWLDTLSGFLDGSGTSPYWFTKTTDGAKTWQPARIIGRITPIPNTFPHQGFRNLSLPIMATGPRSELYVTYADYNPAPLPGDEDGKQADIKIIKSPDGGATWTAPTKVNQDVSNADQFQPYVQVTPRGQVNVSFFDRRLDTPQPPNHPGNFFIDTFLARSNDGGTTWRETRVSHDSWDPSINPPISGSGEFIGDYQGLVADDCAAIPFVNDTHLANDPTRTPGYDIGDPRSPFQQVFSFTVPNTPRFGGTNPDCNGDDGQNGGGDNQGGDAAARAARQTARPLRLSGAAQRAVTQDPHGVVSRQRVILGP